MWSHTETSITSGIILTLAFHIPASIHSLNIQLEDWVGARGAVVLGCLSCGTIVIGQGNEAKDLAGREVIFFVTTQQQIFLCIVYWSWDDFIKLCSLIVVDLPILPDLHWWPFHKWGWWWSPRCWTTFGSHAQVSCWLFQCRGGRAVSRCKFQQSLQWRWTGMT